MKRILNWIKGLFMGHVSRGVIRKQYEDEMRDLIFKLGKELLKLEKSLNVDLADVKSIAHLPIQQKWLNERYNQLLAVHMLMVRSLAKLDNTPGDDDTGSKKGVWNWIVTKLRIQGGGTGND